jgi:hypothetical protein
MYFRAWCLQAMPSVEEEECRAWKRDFEKWSLTFVKRSLASGGRDMSPGSDGRLMNARE